MLKQVNYSFLSDHPEFVPELASWYFQEWGHEVPDRTLAIEQKELEQTLEAGPLPLAMIASYRGELAGAGQLKWKEMAIYPEKEHWLGGIIVKSAYRGQGIGQQLVEQLVGQAQALQIPTLWLQTEQLDGGLYARLGWQPLEVVTQHGVQVLVMERHL